MEPIRILGVSGSLRSASYNTALIAAAAELAGDDVKVDMAQIGGIPLFNADLEAEHRLLPAVVEFRAAVAEADALLFATPEYNFSITAALKNAIDWASRSYGIGGAPLDGKPAAVMGAGGRFGTVRSQLHLREILLHNRVRIVPHQVMIDRASAKFDPTLRLEDERHRDQVRRLMTALRDEVLRDRALTLQ